MINFLNAKEPPTVLRFCFEEFSTQLSINPTKLLLANMVVEGNLWKIYLEMSQDKMTICFYGLGRFLMRGGIFFPKMRRISLDYFVAYFLNIFIPKSEEPM